MRLIIYVRTAKKPEKPWPCCTHDQGPERQSPTLHGRSVDMQSHSIPEKDTPCDMRLS
jgi:hypothetical protein